MSWISDHYLILFLLVAYTAVLAQHALAGKRRTKGLADYYVGGRSMRCSVSDTMPGRCMTI